MAGPRLHGRTRSRGRKGRLRDQRQSLLLQIRPAARPPRDRRGVEGRGSGNCRAAGRGGGMSVSMKDSGVDWIGEVPSHWEVVPPSALFTESKERARDNDPILSATQKYGVIPM